MIKYLTCHYFHLQLLRKHVGTFVLRDISATSTTRSQILKLEGCTSPSHPVAVAFICFSLYASQDKSVKPANTSSWGNLIKKPHCPFLGAKNAGIASFARIGVAPVPPLENTNPHSGLKPTSVMEKKPQSCPKSVLAKVSGQHGEVTGSSRTMSGPCDTL